VIEFTPDGTVKLCAAPVNENVHVTVPDAAEQPGGNAAAAEPASTNDAELNAPTVATATTAKRLISIGIPASLRRLATRSRVRLYYHNLRDAHRAAITPTG
jgi:hypothetical protein